MSTNNFTALVGAALILTSVAPAGAAINSSIENSGGISSLPPNTVVQITGVRDAAPAPINEANAADFAYAASVLGGTAGVLSINGHAHAAEPNGPLDSATGNGNIFYQEAFAVTSSTLPFGTPVSFDVRVAAARRFHAMFGATSFFSG